MQNIENEARGLKQSNDEFKDIDINHLILIKNPDEEIIIGRFRFYFKVIILMPKITQLY